MIQGNHFIVIKVKNIILWIREGCRIKARLEHVVKRGVAMIGKGVRQRERLYI